MTQRTLFPILLVGLPIGLAVSIVVAVYLYYNPLDIPLPSRPKREDVRTLLRRSPNEGDLRDYRRILTTDLAVSRDGQNPDVPAATANWIASTLGPSNLGLEVRFMESEESAGRQSNQTLVVEIPGTRQKNDVILLATGYRSSTAEIDDAVATAALMSVAGAFTGAPQRRTLLIAFLPGETPDDRGLTPLDAVVQAAQLRSQSVRGILDLRVGRPPAPESSAPALQARVVAVAPRDDQPWTTEVREAFAPRKPAGLPLEFVTTSEVPPQAMVLGGWRSSPAPYLLLWLFPAAGNHEGSPLALAQSLEGVLQTLANQ
ncbi:MAG: hypothetical protein ACKV19_08055 [Verrucomicrobiales bacterium]